MARPRTDIAAARQQLLEATEQLLRSQGPQKITVSDVAAACGMSQSNAYRFFPSKQALLAMVGERWFAEFEAEAAAIAADDKQPSEQLEDFVVRLYALKRARYLQDPTLFEAYLALGLANMSVVERHLQRLFDHLVTIMQRCEDQALLGGRRPADAAALVESMTARFRDPVQIVRFIDVDSTDRAAEVMQVILAGLVQVPGRTRSAPAPAVRKTTRRGSA